MSYKPNIVSIRERIITIIIVPIGFVYYTNQLITNGYIEIIFEQRSGLISYYGISAYVLYFGLISLLSAQVSVLVDHYDKRDNEIKYFNFKFYMMFIGFKLCFIATIMNLILNS